jgi:hypothetical protein
MKSPIHIKTYIFTFFATIAIFGTALWVSTFITRQKTEQVKADEDRIAINILSLETEFQLLNASSCKTFNRGALRDELDTLSGRLLFLEGQVGYDNPEVFQLKRYYSLLQIKDYLLTKKMADECHLNTVFILYFYANKDCPDCQTQEYLLRAARYLYPQVEVYNFDYYLDLSAVKTLISLNNIPAKPPVMNINGKPYGTFPDLISLQKIIDKEILAATSTATSTKATSNKAKQ